MIIDVSKRDVTQQGKTETCYFLLLWKVEMKGVMSGTTDIRDIRTQDWKHNYCADNVCCAITEKLCGTVANRWFGKRS